MPRTRIDSTQAADVLTTLLTCKHPQTCHTVHVNIHAVTISVQRRIAVFTPRPLLAALGLHCLVGEDGCLDRRRRDVPERVECGFLRSGHHDGGLCGRQRVGGNWGCVGVLPLREEELVYCVFCARCQYDLNRAMGRQGAIIPWMARSSGRLSRTRLRVRLPQSLLFTRWAREKSQPLVRGEASVSMSIALSY